MTISDPGKVLILDDDPAVGRTISIVGSRAGFECRAATEAEAFFTMLRTWQPTHVIVDLMLSHGDGVDVLNRLGVERADVAVIITSGTGVRVLEAAGRAAAEHGLTVAGLLPKPFSPSSLRALLAITARSRTLADDRHPAPDVTAAMLERAIEDGAITTAYQPKLSCRGGQVVGFECLARWRHPELGPIAPDRFIRIAEENGLIAAVTRTVTDQALAWLGGTATRGDTSMAINISPLALETGDLPVEIDAACARHGIAAERVVLEITETVSTGNPLRMLELLTQFRLRGFKLAIDDFGVGYSSFAALARLPFSEIKIDKSFTMAAEQSEEARKIVAAITGVGQALGLCVTAEGVETPWALHYLERLGCDQVQGYLIARPMDGAAAQAWLRARKVAREA